MSKIFSNLYKYLIFILCIFLCLVLSTGKFSYAVKNGINLWAIYILPAVFPYTFLSILLGENSVTKKLSKKFTPLTRKLFNLDGCVFYAFFLSLISGYPMGAKAISNLCESGELSKKEGKRASILCSTTSPSFTIGTLGAYLFFDIRFGLLIFVCNIISTIITAIIFSIKGRKEKILPIRHIAKETVGSSLYDITYSSIISSLVVGGIITIFYLLTEILFSFGILTPFCKLFSFIFNDESIGKAISFALIENTKGFTILAQANGFFVFPLACSFCAFGGLSIIMQSITFLKRAKIKTALLIISKFFCAVLSFFIGIVLQLIFL